jgi:adenylate cyclase
MAVEIERKFLVTGAGWRQLAGAGKAIRQGFLCAERDRAVRVRVSDGQAKIAIKGAGKGIERLEYEYVIPVDDAHEMLGRLCLGTVVAKTRYCVEHDGRVWEIDVFEDANAGLVLAEVELNAADETIDVPDWAGPEVSEDERYYNAYLARYPFETWGASTV